MKTKVITDQVKFIEMAKILDPKDCVINRKTLKAFGKRFSFNDAGELTKLQEIVINEHGKKEYLTIGVA